MNILVAGAGHGGLIAAAKLAKAGHTVALYEKKAQDALGHDWEDRFTFDILKDAAELPELPAEIWRYRGDCAFLSPDYKTEIAIRYQEEERQKIMWRKPILEILTDYAEKCGVALHFGVTVSAPIIEDRAVRGIQTSDGDLFGDLVIDAAGVFSPVRRNLPAEFGIEPMPKRGDVFYAYRAYFNKTTDEMPELPFEVYLCHAGEQGLSWCCTNEDGVDILIGRIDPLNRTRVQEHIADFRARHAWIGTEILHGGAAGAIPVRRPLALMVAPGYAAVGDSAFMTTPMNGMGIDLSLLAGCLLAETILKNENADLQTLWEYNREFHLRYGGDTAKNEGLKNALLELPQEGVDFLFESAVIQASDLAGAGSRTDVGTLLGKFARGMQRPLFFLAVLNGIIHGAQMTKAYKSAPLAYDEAAVQRWQNAVEQQRVKITRKV